MNVQTETHQPTVRPRDLASLRVPGLTVLWHPEPERIGERAVLSALAAGRPCALSRLEPVFAAPGSPLRRPLLDPHLSRRPLLLEAAAGGVRLRQAECPSPVTVAGAPAASGWDFTAADLARGVVLTVAERVVLLLHLLDPTPPAGVPDFGLVGESAALVALRQEIQAVADLAVPVLLRGESGTGKELVALALHHAGPRRDGPWVAVNLGAVPPALAAAELFGAARGAYTGAERRRDGYFVEAHGGTLFLDEVAETPVEVQALLLRALESGEIQAVGGGAASRVDVRVVAATDADLAAAVAEGRFRAPLLHRLGGYEIRLPPLRERRDDFGRLFLHFLRRELAELGSPLATMPAEPEAPDGINWLGAEDIGRLAASPWPGNVRQLRNAVRRIAVAGRRGDSRAIAVAAVVDRLVQEMQGTAGGEPTAAAQETPAPRPAPAPLRPPGEVGDEELLAALRANRFRIQPTAAQLGISRTSLYARIDRSTSLRKAADLRSEEIARCFADCQGDLDAMVERLEVSADGLERRLRELGLRG